MGSVSGSTAQVKPPGRAAWRYELRKRAKEDLEIERQASGQRKKPRAVRQAEVARRAKEYQRQFPRNDAAARQQRQVSVLEYARQMFQAALEARVTGVLGRADGQWRDRSDRTVVPEFCCGCETHWRSKFRRDGYWKRSLQTQWGKLELRVPRVRCDCGGTVVIAYEQFRPYQRRSVDVQEEILALTGLCLSLRQVRAVLSLQDLKVSITTLSKEVGKVADLTAQEFQGKCRVAPVIQLDAIWGHLAEETEEVFYDRRGRKRTRKVVQKVPLLVAWGIWPQSGEKALLAWEIGKEEDTATWQKLLEKLHARGVHADKGLRLFISDGGSGLLSALSMVSFGAVRHQRCVFHKMRNVIREVTADKSIKDEKERREQRKKRRGEMLTEMALIWQAKTEEEARARYAAFVAKWEKREPKAVARLTHGFEETLVFYQVQAAAAARGEEWPARYLRTTSSLERVNRSIRLRMRVSTTFQTEEGLYANVYLALGARGKNKPGEFREWAAGLVVRLEELERAA